MFWTTGHLPLECDKTSQVLFISVIGFIGGNAINHHFQDKYLENSINKDSRFQVKATHDHQKTFFQTTTRAIKPLQYVISVET